MKSNGQKILRSFNKMLSLGIHEDTSIWLSSKIKILNIMSLFSSFLSITLGILNLLFSYNTVLSIIDIVAGILMIVPYILNYKQKYILARVLFILFSYGVLAIFFVVYGGEEVMFKYYFLPAVGLPFIFLSNEISYHKWMLSFFGVFIWLSIEILELYIDPILTLDPQGAEICAIISTFALFGTIILMFSAFSNENNHHLKKISEMNNQLSMLSITDDLTGLYNRRHVMTVLSRYFSRSKYNNHHLSLAIFDIDHFKQVNDVYGHVAGDKVLYMISQIAKEHFKDNHIIGRVGGEEFCIIFSEGNISLNKDLIEAFREIISNNQIEYKDVKIPITISIGYAHFNHDMDQFVDLYRLADERLYSAKNNGRNQMCDSNIK